MCLGSLPDYCPESLKKSGSVFFQNGEITESIFNVLVPFFLNTDGGRTDGRTDIFFPNVRSSLVVQVVYKKQISSRF